MNAPDRIWADGDASLVKTANEWDWSGGCWGHQPERDGEVEYIRADLVPQWQPIETAPKDGTEILGAWQCLNKTWDMNKVVFFEGFWWTHYMESWHDPTHWMPLPAPPQPTARHST